MADKKTELHLLSADSYKHLSHDAFKALSIILKSIMLRPPLSMGPLRVLRLTLSGSKFQITRIINFFREVAWCF